MSSRPYGHDPTDPLSQLAMLEACLLAVRLPPCPHCHVQHEAIPMAGVGWAVEHIHEPGCPEHDDNQPDPERPGHELS
jgi:hypothetical protein